MAIVNIYFQTFITGIFCISKKKGVTYCLGAATGYYVGKYSHPYLTDNSKKFMALPNSTFGEAARIEKERELRGDKQKSAEEIKVMIKWTAETVIYRSLPISTSLGAVAYFAVKSGIHFYELL